MNIMKDMSSIIYLASPYTGTPKEMQTRYEEARGAVAELLRANLHIYSPIIHCHDLALVHDLPKDAAFWWKYDKSFLDVSSEFWILTLDGWKTSKGVRKEAQYAIQKELPIKYVSLVEAQNWNK